MGGGGKGKGGPPPPPSGADAAKAAAELQRRKREQMEEEKRRAQEAIARAKEFEAGQRDLEARLPTLQSHDIGLVPWDTALAGMHLAGGKGTDHTGGVDVVELPDELAVCVRQGASIITESIVDAMATLLGVRVARMRLVHADCEESRAIKDVITKWHSNFSGGKYFEKWIAQIAPADQAKMRARVNRAGPYAVLEFVPGTSLDTSASHMEAASPDLLADLGEICALDLLLNNMDRLPLPCWGNAGNLTNAIVTPLGRLVGIDQQVNPIDPGPGLDAYLGEVRGLSAQVFSGSAPAISTGIGAAIQKSCGIQLSDSSQQHVVRGMCATLRKAVLESREGRLAETLALAASKAAETKLDFEGYYGHVTPIDSADVAAKNVAFLRLVVDAAAAAFDEIKP